LADEWVTPVMTPALAERCKTIDDLAKLPLIVDQSIDFLSNPSDWSAWFRLMDSKAPEIHGPKFSQADHAVDAALAGVGAVLGRRALVIKDIADGRLVAPFKIAMNTGARFRFICQKGQENRPAIKAFRDWMIEEVAKTQAISDGFVLRPVPAPSEGETRVGPRAALFQMLRLQPLDLFFQSKFLLFQRCDL
jgi:LysR family glycine cleavage system transcriptional activator